MKKLISCLLSLSLCFVAFSQTATVQQMSKAEINRVFTKEVNSKFKINFSVWKAFHITDATGSYFVTLTEKFDGYNDEGDSNHYAIKAVYLQQTSDSLVKKWEINDASIKGKTKDDFSETSIWFWTKYCSFIDLDGDGIADPIVIYGTHGINGYDDGRIKFIIYYKNKKIAIRHQNGVLDNQRETQVDAAFYNLPSALQQSVQKTMKLMMANNHAIFPAGWEKAMAKKLTVINERNGR
jgi:hypothetical protein